MEDQITQPNKKNNKGGCGCLIILLVLGILILISFLNKEDSKTTPETPEVQDTQQQNTQEQQIEKDAKACKQKTIEKYGKDMYFFCGCRCGSFFWEENVDGLGNCLENCWKNFETIWQETP